MSRIPTTPNEIALFQGICDRIMNNPDNDLIDLTCNNVGIVSLRANKDALGLIKPDSMDETRWLNLQKNCIIRPMRQQKEAHERAIEEARERAIEEAACERAIDDQAEAFAEEARA